MPTLIEYQDRSNIFKSCLIGPDLTHIGYLSMDTKDVLKELFHSFYIVNFLGIEVPSRSEYANYNNGLRISFSSEIKKESDLVKTIDLNNSKNPFLLQCRHEVFSKEKLSYIAEKLKASIRPWQRHQEPLHHDEAEKYSFIFDIIGFKMTPEEITRFSTHENYYDPIDNGGILDNCIF